MTLPSSGLITFNQINVELGRSPTAYISLNDPEVRALAGKPSGLISLSDLHGKSAISPPTIAYASTTGDGSMGSYLYVNYTVGGSSPVTSGAWISGGGYINAVKMSTTQWRFVSNQFQDTAPRTGTYRVTASNAGGSAYVDRAIAVYDFYDGGGSCFTGDSLVLMADGSRKRIDQIVPGDEIKTPFGSSAVDWIRKPILGNRPLMAFPGGKCKTSAEHCLWTKDDHGIEWWATRDIRQWRYETANDLGPGFNGVEPIDLCGEERFIATFATEEGWTTVDWIVVENADTTTQLYHLYLEDHASFFVDGFLVSGELPQVKSLIDWEQFSWDSLDPQFPIYRIEE